MWRRLHSIILFKSLIWDAHVCFVSAPILATFWKIQWRFPISLFSWGRIRKKPPFENWQIYFWKPRKIKCCNVGQVWFQFSIFQIKQPSNEKDIGTITLLLFHGNPNSMAVGKKILTQHIYTDSWFFFRCHAGHKEKSITPITWKYLPEANNNNLLSKPDKFIFSEKTNIGWQKSANHFCPQALNQSKSL